MKKAVRCVVGLTLGAAYALLVLISAQWLIRSLGEIAGWVCGWAGLDADIAEMAALILGQLKKALIAGPWVPALLIGAAAGLGIAFLPSKRGIRALFIALMILLFIPMVLVALWFTEINSIRLGALIETLLPMVSALM